MNNTSQTDVVKRTDTTKYEPGYPRKCLGTVYACKSTTMVSTL